MGKKMVKKRLKFSGAMRVLLVVRWPVGGIRTFMRYVYLRFPVESFSFTLIAPDLPETKVLLDDLSGGDVTLIPVSSNPSVVELCWTVTKQLLHAKFDIVHSHGFTSGVCAALPARLTRVPHLLTSHDVLQEKQFSHKFGKLKRRYIGIAISFIDTIQSVSHDAQKNLLEFFPRIHERCLVISNGIEIERFQQAEPRNLRKELFLSDEYFLIGFLGRFMRQKGFNHLVDAVEQLTRHQNLKKILLVLAFGEGGFIREERAALRQRGLEGNFYFMPFTPNVAGVIKGLDLVVMPSLWEACPLLPMEVLTCGTPLVASNCTGLREVVQGTPTVVVEAGNSSALATGIKDCLEESRLQQFIDYIPKAAQRYNVQPKADMIRDLMNKMVSKMPIN
ncbi:glycosyltransferase family 4 protein [Desulfobulbus rhabdoformis]|uniref:glycosyltransferase family 4 protein n=1 Tax=Desulfobulbus rhabdoformis TaxID=34032 RepID=UPI001964F997|nr:glycosyltransferase family 4 protein [Desulfobulbus rhabdoformis]MBM9616708.1 glycosyltransferase family 4 protein [Desulfobulbus rhabdoformis]